MGNIAGIEACKSAQGIKTNLTPLSMNETPGASKISWLDLEDIGDSLKSLMWRNVGIERNEKRLLQAEEMIDMWCKYVMDKEFSNPEGWELQNMLLVASLIVSSAYKRRESRGVHHRTDYPQTDDIHWKKHLVLKK